MNDRTGDRDEKREKIMRIPKGLHQLKSAVGPGGGAYALDCMQIAAIDCDTVRVAATNGVVAVIRTITSPGHAVAGVALIPASFLRSSMAGGWLAVSEIGRVTVTRGDETVSVESRQGARYPDIAAVFSAADIDSGDATVDISVKALSAVAASVAGGGSVRIRVPHQPDRPILIETIEDADADADQADVACLVMPLRRKS
jgi:hypothetical protein